MSDYVYSSTDRISKWVGYKALERMKRGECHGMDAIDVAAVCEGQADSKMRGYSRKKHLFDDVRKNNQHG